MMTPSARYADILLPDTLGPETNDAACQGGSHGDVACMLAIQEAVKPMTRSRPLRSAGFSPRSSGSRRNSPKAALRWAG